MGDNPDRYDSGKGPITASSFAWRLSYASMTIRAVKPMHACVASFAGMPPRQACGPLSPAGRRSIFAAVAISLVILLLSAGCSGPPRYTSVRGGPGSPVAKYGGSEWVGIASYYGKDFHGKTTANGEIFDMYAMTAAHRTMPLGTVVEVRNLENGKKVVVRINDRGPYVEGRILDLSYGAAKKLDMIGPGTVKVRVKLLKKAEKK